MNLSRPKGTGMACRDVSLIGVPTDIGASRRGASMGPEAMRVAGIRGALEGQGLVVHDLGDLQGPANPDRMPEQGYRHLAEVTVWNRSVHDAVLAELLKSRLPIVLGGDHCLAIGSISAVARRCRDTGKALRVLWLDAHADFNTSELTPSGNLHGMPLACLCGLGPTQLTGLAGAVPDCCGVVGLWHNGLALVDFGQHVVRHVVGAHGELGHGAQVCHGPAHIHQSPLGVLDDGAHLGVNQLTN